MKRFKCLFVLACATVFLIAGCGGSDDGDSGPDESDTPASSAGTAPGGGPAPTADSAEPTEAPSDGEATGAELPPDACALLTLPEVQQLAPMAQEGTATSDEGAITSVGCVWDWSDPPGAIDGTGSLEVHVSSLPPGVSEQTIRQSLTVEVADAGENGRELSGIGEYAIMTSVIGGSAEVQALVNGQLVTVELVGYVDGDVAREKQDDVIPLAELVAERT